MMLAAPVYAQDDAEEQLESAQEMVQTSVDSGVVPGLGQVVDEDGNLSVPGLLPGEEEEEVKKKYVYNKPTADDEFFGTTLPRRVFNNVKPRF